MPMRCKHVSAAAAIASVVAGMLLLRFRRIRHEAREGEAIAPSDTLAARQSSTERESTGQLSRGVLFGRIEDNFATGYQTMTAIIQGVALVLLVSTSAHAVFGSPSRSQVATAASQAVAVFVIIIVTTDQFFQLATATRWIPTTFDIAVPYLVGAGEATAALWLGDDTRWWASIAWFWLAGAIAYAHTAVRSTPKGFEGIKEYHLRFIRSARRSRDICAALCACAGVLAVTTALVGLPPWLYVASPWALTAALIVRASQLRWAGVLRHDA
jgi:hypothetical protein